MIVMELLPDFNELFVAFGVLYFWYAPLILILSRPGFNFVQRLRWGVACLALSWLSYFLMKQQQKS
jgi:hypothetical protein